MYDQIAEALRFNELDAVALRFNEPDTSDLRFNELGALALPRKCRAAWTSLGMLARLSSHFSREIVSGTWPAES